MKRHLFVLVAAVSLSCARNTVDYSEIISEMHSCHDTAQWTAPDLYSALQGTYDWQYVHSWGWGEPYQSESDYAGWTLTLNADSTYSVNSAAPLFSPFPLLSPLPLSKSKCWRMVEIIERAK